ncbi:hypothetical protein AB0C02_01705 [Micromonospora sp. NPDC048999]|uniref:type II secretion system F family protein n=1 Tax=Micromonospora sp. NPDC048999 TaxID=3155391 RepID=UPI003402F668
MTVQGWLVTVLLVAAAAVVAWPVRAGRARQRAVLRAEHRDPVPSGGLAHRRLTDEGAQLRQGTGIGGEAGTTARGGCRVAPAVADRPLPTRPPGRHDGSHPARAPVAGRRPRAALSNAPTSAGALATLPAGRTAGPGQLPEWVVALATRRGLLMLVLGGTGTVLGGPVAAAVLAAYGGLTARAVRRRRARQLADRARRHELDQLSDLAADLRAGLPIGGAVVDGPHRTARLARAAVRLADRTGAPLAELLERVEADARAADRGLAAADAQAAGSRATAWLLAALPLGGIGLGYTIGVDPVAVLLHTTIGGGSALAAVALQIGGLLWAERLGAAPGRDR